MCNVYARLKCHKRTTLLFQEAGSDGLVPDLTIVPDTITYKSITQIAWCTVLAFVISLEVRCGSVTMPG